MNGPGGYRETFLSEARANLAAMNAALLEAERPPERLGLIDEAFRAAHGIKGMAAMMELERTAALCHALEDALDAVRKGALPLREAADVLFRCFDVLAGVVAAVERGEPEPDLSAAAAELRRLPRRREAPPPAGTPAEPAAPAPIASVPVRMERLDALMNLAEELVVARLRFEELRAKAGLPELAAFADALDRLASELQFQVTQARLVPVRLVFERLPRMVRDLARRQGKEARLELQGGDIELDRRVAEEAGETLIHLLRNAVDHGIEAPEARQAAGKPAHGTIRVAVTRGGDAAMIAVEDDGAGLDLAGIARAAAARGLAPPQARREDLLAALVSGLSTRPRATAVSGRGLGLDIVRRRVESIGGTLAVSSEAGKGTAFRIAIPLTLAVIKGLFAEVAGRMYALPLAGVEKVVTVEPGQVRGVLGREAVVIDGEGIPLLRLRGVLGAPAPGLARFPVVVVGREKERYGIAVDALLAAQDIVLKPLSRLLRGDGRFAGSTIVGTGEPVLVLDLANIAQSARGGGRA